MPPAPRKYTAADIYFFVESGLFDNEAKFELFDGEIVPTSPKGNFHEAMREILMDWFQQPWITGFRFMVEHTLTIDDRTILESDFILYRRAVSIGDGPLTGKDILLVIEVADSSLNYDLTAKAAKYAAFGAAEYWVINAKTREVHIHRNASEAAWADLRNVAPGQSFAPSCAPTASLKF